MARESRLCTAARLSSTLMTDLRRPVYTRPMRLQLWVPEIARRSPRREFVLRYRVLAPVLPYCLEVLPPALDAAGVTWKRTAEMRWELGLAWRTMVLGVVRRDVDETVSLSIASEAGASELRLECRPFETHGAHAAGFAGVLVLAITAWIAGGWGAGIPAGLTTAVAGGLWADTMREMAFRVLERRLRRLAEDLGISMWPGKPGEIVGLAPGSR